MRGGRIAAIAALTIVAAAPATAGAAKGGGLWKLYDQTLSRAR